MPTDRTRGQRRKTHEQFLRRVERKDDLPKAREVGRSQADIHAGRARLLDRPEARQSEFAVSRGGMNQESDHNKHHDPGQPGHKPRKPSPAQEKQTRG